MTGAERLSRMIDYLHEPETPEETPVSTTTVKASVAWQQTATERYDTDVNERAETALAALGLTVEGHEGGCGLDPADPLPAEQCVYVNGPQSALDAAPDALRFILGNPETVTVSRYS